MKYTAAQFIQEVLIEPIKDIIEKHPFHAFFLLCPIVEILGKCLNKDSDWHFPNHSKKDFNNALKTLTPLKKYSLLSADLYSIVRCGLLHAGIPKEGIKLCPNNNDLSNNTIGCKELYYDIKCAWEEIKNNDLAKKEMKTELFEVYDSISGGTQTSIHTQLS